MMLSHSRGPGAAAAYCHELLTDSRLPAGMTRAHLLLQAGDYHQLAGEHDEAHTAYAAAVDDGGECLPTHVAISPAGYSITVTRMPAGCWPRRSKPNALTTLMCTSSFGEAFESIDDLAEATRWFTTGALRLLRDEDSGLGYDEARLLQGRRRRVRLAQGFTGDDYDRLVAPSE